VDIIQGPENVTCGVLSPVAGASVPSPWQRLHVNLVHREGTVHV
jgi:hypothetical protein